MLLKDQEHALMKRLLTIVLKYTARLGYLSVSLVMDMEMP